MPLTVHIITPERSWEPMVADRVTLPAFDGQVGILKTMLRSFVSWVKVPWPYVLIAQPITSWPVKAALRKCKMTKFACSPNQSSTLDEVSEGGLVARMKELDATTFANSAEKFKLKQKYTGSQLNCAVPVKMFPS